MQLDCVLRLFAPAVPPKMSYSNKSSLLQHNAVGGASLAAKMAYPSQHMNPFGQQTSFAPSHAFPSNTWGPGSNASNVYNDFMLPDSTSASTTDSLGISVGNFHHLDQTPNVAQQRSMNAQFMHLAQVEVRWEGRMSELRSRIERLEK